MPASAPLSPSRAALITPVLIGSCAIVIVCFAIRSSFGLFQIPVADEFGWPRAEFSLAIAIQNLAWGIGQPIFSGLADRFGNRLAIILGAVCYALGLALSAYAATSLEHQIWNFAIGFGIAGTGVGMVIAVVGRAASPEHRSLSLGIVTAAASVGQVAGPPVASALLSVTDWSGVFLIFAAASLASLVFLPLLRAPDGGASQTEIEESMAAVVGRALRDRSFFLIFVGFFSCGYQLAFVTAHFPAFVAEVCGPIDPAGILAGIGIGDTTALGAWALALIGLTNIAGTIVAGRLGATYSKKYLLAAIYAGRTIAAAWFILVPMTPATVLIFSVAMGSLWLATVPLTSGLIGQIWGMKYMGTLYGIVFFSHQLGSFLGVWMGGELYDRFGSYDVVWWVGVGVGLLSVIVHLPVVEERRAPAPVAA